MDVQVTGGSITEVKADTAVVNLFQGVKQPGGATGAVDQALGGALTELIAAGDFRGKLNETTLIYTFGRIPARKVIVVGLGEQAKFNLDRVRQAAAAAAVAARSHGGGTLASIVHGAGIGGLDPAAATRATVEGTVMGLYRFPGYKHKPEEEGREISRLQLVERTTDRLAVMEAAADEGAILAAAVNRARTLANRPGNKMTPRLLAEEAASLARELGLGLEVLEEEQLRQKGMGGLLGVGQGSTEPPRMITLTYEGTNSDRVLALVGKGITFDSGGISLKPSRDMHEMKYDMSGAAAVFGAMDAIARLKPQAKVIAVLPAAENMPGAHAQKPGDIVETFGGKSVEVLNTDAEGRLILADGVAYARSRGATHIVDIATLTGAVVVALGHDVAAVLGNNDELLHEVQRAGEEAGERLWQLPAVEEYKESLKSDVADLKNVGGGDAGTIVGGLFIGEFAGDVPWVHVDIAGTAYTNKDKGFRSKGSTGFGVRTLARLARSF